MPDSEFRSDAAARGEQAEAMLAELFAAAGWKVRLHDRLGASDVAMQEVDMVIEGQGLSYAVEVKAAPEGRGDRLIPLWSQACLQASRAAQARKNQPLAVVAAP